MPLDLSALLPPYQPVELPSRGKFYVGHPYLEKGMVNIREYCAQEESMLSQMNRENVQYVLNAIINNCTEGNWFDAEELTTEDLFFLLVWLRANSYGPTYSIEVKCPHDDCGHEDMYDVNLNSLTIYQLTDDDPNEPLEVRLPKTGALVEVRCMRRSMEIQAAKRQQELKSMRGLHKGDISDLLKRAYSISKVTMPNGQSSEDRLEIEQLCLSYLPSADSLAIDQALDKFRHGIDVNISIECNACSRPVFTVVPPGPEFFRPARLTLEIQGEPAPGHPDSESVRATGRDVFEVSEPVGASATAEHVEGHDGAGAEGTG